MKLLIALSILIEFSISVAIQNKILSTSFIDTINQKQSLWRAGRNFPEDTPYEHLKRLAGGLPRPKSERVNRKLDNITTYDIPESFDARNAWPNCPSINVIRNQGGCGSCWAFGAAETMTDRICIASGGSVNFQFSPEDLIECCTECTDTYGCESGYTYRAWNYWVQNGIVSGGDAGSNAGCKPYSFDSFSNGQVLACARSCQNGQDYNSDRHFGVENHYLSYNVEQIQNELMSNGPVEAYFEVYEDFYNYQSGVYQHTTGNLVGGHFVKIIGWGTENGVPYWLAANSWGTEWGSMGGLFKILRGQNHVNIEMEIDVGTPKF